MKILHTADWHVGKVLKGRSRTDEHHAVLGELAQLADDEDVDLTIVAGDVFDTAAPAPESQQLAVRILLALREGGRNVVVLGGNHDNLRLLDVYRTALADAGIHVVGTFRRPEEGGLLRFTARSGEPVRLAALPFLSHRYAVRAADVLTGAPDQRNLDYADRIDRLVTALTGDFADDTVNLVTTHGTLPGGKLGGGEREAQTVFSYYFRSSAFPTSTQYAALGHLHRRQRMDGPCPIWYSGSPIAVDFGEQENAPGALLVEAEPGAPARVREHTLSTPRRLRTVRGNLDQLEAMAGDLGEAWLRVVVREKPRPGLADQVRELLPGALSVDIDEQFRPTGGSRRRAERNGSSPSNPRELFRGYLTDTGRTADGEVAALFDRLHDEETSPPAGGH